MEDENEPLIPNGSHLYDFSRCDSGSSKRVRIARSIHSEKSPINRPQRSMSYPGDPEDDDSVTATYQRIGGIDEDTILNLSMRHIVLRNKRAEHSTTELQTFVHLVKANLGSGLLALPYAISQVGYIVGPLVLASLGIMAIHSMILLVNCCQVLCKRYDVVSLDFGEAVEAAFWQFKINKRIRQYHITGFTLGKIAKLFINTLLILTQFGFCCVYFVFMSQNLKQVFDASGAVLGEQVWVGILLPMIILLCWIRNLDTLVPLAIVANLCLFFGLGVILYHVFYLFAEKEARIYSGCGVVAASIGGTALPAFFGNALYSYEGIGMILPLENKMKTPKNFSRVLLSAMLVITFIFVSIGTLGYLAFGSEIEDSITLNLPKDKHLHSVVFHTAKLYLSFAVFVTYALVFYVPLDFMEPPLFRRFKIDKTKDPKKAFLLQVIFRSAIVTVTAVLAIAIPEIHLFISLIGAFASSVLAIIVPPILQIMLFYNVPEPRWQKMLWIAKSVFIVCVGVLGFITGTYTSLQNIVMFLRGEKQSPTPCY